MEKQLIIIIASIFLLIIGVVGFLLVNKDLSQSETDPETEPVYQNEIDQYEELPIQPKVVTCTADNTWNSTSPMLPGQKVTRKCSNGKLEVSTCGENGFWTSSGCPA